MLKNTPEGVTVLRLRIDVAKDTLAELMPHSRHTFCPLYMLPMEITGVCVRCGDVARIVYSKSPPQSTDPQILGRGEAIWSTTIACPRCGTYRRPPYASPDTEHKGRAAG